jgi:hypothetical protein
MVKEFVYLLVWCGGVAVEVNGRNHYFREMLEYTVVIKMRQVMEATDVNGPALKKVMG